MSHGHPVSYYYILADDCDVLVHGQEPSNNYCWESLFNMMITINPAKVAGAWDGCGFNLYNTNISTH